MPETVPVRAKVEAVHPTWRMRLDSPFRIMGHDRRRSACDPAVSRIWVCLLPYLWRMLMEQRRNGL